MLGGRIGQPTNGGLLDARYVLKTGDTMTGALVINHTASAALTINTDAIIVDGATDRVAIGRALVTSRTLAVGGSSDFYGELNMVIAGENTGAFKAYKEGEAAARFQFTNQGDVQWGSGTGAADTTLIRRAANRLQTYGQFYIGPYDNPVFKFDGANAGVVINEEGVGTGDFRLEGDTDVNLIYADYSADSVGIGTTTPASKLEVVGTVRMDGLRIDQTPTAETPTATHTITINANGTNYKLLCVAA